MDANFQQDQYIKHCYNKFIEKSLRYFFLQTISNVIAQNAHCHIGHNGAKQNCSSRPQQPITLRFSFFKAPWKNKRWNQTGYYGRLRPFFFAPVSPISAYPGRKLTNPKINVLLLFSARTGAYIKRYLPQYEGSPMFISWKISPSPHYRTCIFNKTAVVCSFLQHSDLVMFLLILFSAGRQLLDRSCFALQSWT